MKNLIRLFLLVFSFVSVLAFAQAESGVKATFAAEVITTLDPGQQLTTGGLLVRVTKLWDWRKGDGSVPLPAADQIVILTEFKKQDLAAMGEKYLVKAEPAGLAKAESGERVRVWKVTEELDPTSYLQR